MWRWNPARTWSASCSFRRARAISGLRLARTLGERVQGRAGKVALTVDANDETLRRHRRRAQARHAATARQRDAGAGRGVRTRFGLPVMKALPIAERDDLSPIREYAQGRRPADLRCARAAGRDAARRARQALRLDAAQGHRSGRAIHAVGRARREQCRPGAAHHPRARRRRVVRRRARARREGPGQNPRLHPRRARARPNLRSSPARRDIVVRRHAHDRAAAQFIPHRPRRARAFRHLWRPLRRRDADAADSRSRESLRARPRPIRHFRRRWTAISRTMSAGHRRSISPSG